MKRKKNASGFECYVLSSYLWKVLLSHLNISALYFLYEMYRWLGDVWTTSGSKDSCTCPYTYATVIYEEISTLTLKPIFFCSLTTRSIHILHFCGSLNILGLHLPLQCAGFPQTFCTVFLLTLFILLTLVLLFLMFVSFFFPLSGSRLCTQLSFFLLSSWLLWLAH